MNPRHSQSVIGSTFSIAILISTLGSISTPHTRAAELKVGEVAPDFTLIARKAFTLPNGQTFAAGAEVKLSDFAGSVVFFEWFAVWCPFCIAAAPQITSGIAHHYESSNGNPNSVPVIHVAVNQESRGFYQTQTDQFIEAQGFGITVNDYTPTSVNKVRALFQAAGQPIFVAINAVTYSPTHKPWEILVNHLGFGDTQFNDDIQRFRTLINKVEPTLPAPVIALPPSPISDTGFALTIQTVVGKTYRIEATSSLEANQWSPVYTFLGKSEPITYQDTNAPAAQKFYRVVSAAP